VLAEMNVEGHELDQLLTFFRAIYVTPQNSRGQKGDME